LLRELKENQLKNDPQIRVGLDVKAVAILAENLSRPVREKLAIREEDPNVRVREATGHLEAIRSVEARHRVVREVVLHDHLRDRNQPSQCSGVCHRVANLQTMPSRNPEDQPVHRHRVVLLQLVQNRWPRMKNQL